MTPQVDESLSNVIRQKLARRPFQPFVINTIRGEKILVARTLQAAANDRMLIVLPIEGDGTRRFMFEELASVVDV